MIKVLKKMVKSTKSRDFRTFLLFLLLSALLWHIEKLRQTYTVTTRLHIECEDVPHGYITPPYLNKSVVATLEGNGFSLLKMYLTDSRNIKVAVSPLHRLTSGGEMWAIYVPRRLAGQKTDLPEHIKIADVLTDTVMIPLLTVYQKKMPVILRDHVDLAQQRTFSSPRLITPDSVIVTATSDILDTMTAVYTPIQAPIVLTDSTVLSVPLQIPVSATSSAYAIDVNYNIEPLTEKKMSVPIRTINVPSGYSCRLFPPSAKVTFSVGLSHFEDAEEDDFDVVADFKNVHPGAKDSRISIDVHGMPACSQNVTFSPSFAEFILERTNRK